MRGSFNGALDRVYLHSPVTAALYYAVAEAENQLFASLLQGVMWSSLYANSRLEIPAGNESIPKMIKAAMSTVPYIRFAGESSPSGVDQLVDEWKRVNAEMAAEKAKEDEGVHG